MSLHSRAGILIVLAAVTSPAPLLAEGKEDRPALPADLNAVPRDASAFVSIRVAELWNSPFMEGARRRLAKRPPEFLEDLKEQTGLSPEGIERVTIVFLTLDSSNDQLVVVSTREPYDREKIRRPLANAREERLGDRTYYVGGGGRSALHLLGERAFLYGPTVAVRQVLSQRADEQPTELESSLLAATRKPLVVGVNGVKVGRELAHLSSDAPWVATLLQARSATLACSLGEAIDGEAVLRFADEERARAGQKAVQAALPEVRRRVKGLRDDLPQKERTALAKVLGGLTTALEDPLIQRAGAEVRVSARMRVDLSSTAGALAEEVLRAQAGARRVASANNMKDFGVAFHNYYDTHKQFPPQAIFSKDGKALLSWRVLLLPYLEKEYKELYEQFHLDEPWDSEHNKKLIARMPSVYAVPGSKAAQAHETHYRAFVGNGAFFKEKGPTKLADIPDGLSQTIAVVEAEKSVPWTKPEELPFDPDKPLPKLGGLFKGGFNALFIDGHVTILPLDVHPVFLKRLITRAERVAPGAGGIPAVEY